MWRRGGVENLLIDFALSLILSHLFDFYFAP